MCGAQLKVRVGILRIALDRALGERHGALEMLAEGLVDVRRRGRSRNAAADLPQVVVGGDGPLGKQRPDP